MTRFYFLVVFDDKFCIHLKCRMWVYTVCEKESKLKASRIVKTAQNNKNQNIFLRHFHIPSTKREIVLPELSYHVEN